MSPDLLIFAYVTLLLGGLVILSIYGGIRRRRFRQTESDDRIFRCAKCGLVYTDDFDVDRSRCSQCGKLNEAFKF
jgi:protein-arginine kinase activator protein McsA